MYKRYTHNPKVQAIESTPQKIKKPKKRCGNICTLG